MAASRWPPGSTTKLSICEVPVRVPMRWSPVALKNTIAQAGVAGTVTVVPGIAVKLPPRCRRKPGRVRASLRWPCSLVVILGPRCLCGRPGIVGLVAWPAARLDAVR